MSSPSKRDVKFSPTKRAKTNKQPDWQDQLKEMQLGLELMRKEADAILTKAGMTPEEMEVALSNPSNFSAEDWALIESARQQAALFKDELARIFPAPAAEAAKKPKKPRSKAKKNWIPIQ